MTIINFEQTAAGQLIEELLAHPATLARMDELSRLGRPAVGALDEQLAGRLTLSHTERQHVGRRVRTAMADRGWKGGLQRRLSGGTVLTSGTVYVRGDGPMADRYAGIPTELLPMEERIARVQELVRRFSKNDYGVDDYLAEKWAEQDAELARDRAEKAA